MQLQKYKTRISSIKIESSIFNGSVGPTVAKLVEVNRNFRTLMTIILSPATSRIACLVSTVDVFVSIYLHCVL